MKSDNLFKVHLICVCLFVGFFVVFSSGKIKGQENKYQVPPYLYHSKMQDIYNDILCDAKSAVHLAGTSTNANVRGDANGGTARDSTKTYEYFVDATATDQGSATTMANRSIKDLVDSIEKNISATLVLTHSGSGNTTVYTLTTSETIPKNISLRIENGAILDGTGTLKINGPFECGLHQCFGSSITVSFGSGAIKEVYSEWWGIDGKSDDTEIEAAIASLPSTGGTLRLLDAKIYTLSADGIDVKDVSNLTIKGGVGTVIDGSSVITANKILDITGSLSGTSTIASASISKDDRAISITDSGGFTEGQMIFIYTATEPFSENDSSYKKGELAVIASVSAGTVTITVGARDDYDIGEGTINIAEIDPIKNFRIETLKILGRGSASEHDGLVINYAYNPRVTNIEMEDAEDNGIVFGYTLNGIIDKCAVINTDGGGAVPGYAYSFTNATSDSIIRGSFARNFRHAWTCAGKYPTWSNVVTENEFVHNVGNFGAIVPHRNSSKLSIIGNYVRDSFIGIQANGPNTLIANNNIQTNPTDGYGIYVIDDGQLDFYAKISEVTGGIDDKENHGMNIRVFYKKVK